VRALVTLAAALLSDTAQLRARTSLRVERTIPTAKDVPARAIAAIFDLQYEKIATAVRELLPEDVRHGLTAAQPLDHSRVAWALELLRHRPDVVVGVCSATLAETIAAATGLADRLGAPPAALVSVLDAATVVSDTAALSLTAARPAGFDRAPVSGDADLRARLARALLFGGSTPTDLRAALTVYDIDAECEYVAFVAQPDPGRDAAALFAELDAVQPYQYRNGLVAIVDGVIVGFLAEAPAKLRHGGMGVGPARPLDRLAESFQLARRAMDTMQAFGVTGVHSFDTLGLLPIVLSDSDVGDCLHARYVGPATGPGAPVGLLTAVRAWYECGMHVERAARHAELHPNTMRHRITRFQELTGANLREPVIAMEVWWALCWADLVERAAGRPHPTPAPHPASAPHPSSAPHPASGPHPAPRPAAPRNGGANFPAQVAGRVRSGRTAPHAERVTPAGPR
jgi:hypothetical protein